MHNLRTTVRRHLATTAAAGVTVVALAGGGIAYAATSGSSSSNNSPAVAASPAPSATPAAARPTTHAKAAKAAHHRVRGTITAISNGSWTVRTKKGVTLTVEVSARTKFGTKASPATAASFPVGASVAVIGTRSGATVTARHVFTPKMESATANGATTPTTS